MSEVSELNALGVNDLAGLTKVQTIAQGNWGGITSPTVSVCAVRAPIRRQIAPGREMTIMTIVTI